MDSTRQAMASALSDSAILWIPLAAVVAHLIEEFVWPGGFPEWYRWFRPERAASMTTRFFVVINGIFVVLALLPPILGPSPRAYAFWTMVAAIAGANALFHIWATLSRRRYSPGTVTGLVVYLPLAFVGLGYLLRRGSISPGTLIQGIVIGIGFHIWSRWNHTRRAKAVAGQL
jgi:hypothetical protein